MAQRKKKELQVSESQPNSTPPIPLGANSGGPAPLTGNRAARLSREDKKEAKKPKRESKMLEFQCRVSDYANDHMPDVKNWHIPRPAAIAAGLMMFGLTLT